MPCRCCGAVYPPEGLEPEKNDKQINSLLKEAARQIKDKHSEMDEEKWKKGWLEAFEHHLFGCPKKNITS